MAWGRFVATLDHRLELEPAPERCVGEFSFQIAGRCHDRNRLWNSNPNSNCRSELNSMGAAMVFDLSAHPTIESGAKVAAGDVYFGAER